MSTQVVTYRLAHLPAEVTLCAACVAVHKTPLGAVSHGERPGHCEGPDHGGGCARHTKTDGSWWEHDARGIPLCRVCAKCEAEKLARYRPEILSGYSQGDVGEQIEPDDGGFYMEGE